MSNPLVKKDLMDAILELRAHVERQLQANKYYVALNKLDELLAAIRPLEIVEARVLDGWVDVLASKTGERVALEIETGRSDTLSNIRRCLRHRVTRIVVVATSDAVSEQLERRIAAAGLLIPHRVHLIRASSTLDEVFRS